MEILRKGYFFLKTNILLPMPKFSNSLSFHTTGNLAVECSPHPGFPGPSGYCSHNILNRILQNKIITRAPPSSRCPASGAKPLKQGQQAGCALPLLGGGVTHKTSRLEWRHCYLHRGSDPRPWPLQKSGVLSIWCHLEQVKGCAVDCAAQCLLGYPERHFCFQEEVPCAEVTSFHPQSKLRQSTVLRRMMGLSKYVPSSRCFLIFKT